MNKKLQSCRKRENESADKVLLTVNVSLSPFGNEVNSNESVKYDTRFFFPINFGRLGSLVETSVAPMSRTTRLLFVLFRGNENQINSSSLHLFEIFSFLSIADLYLRTRNTREDFFS